MNSGIPTHALYPELPASLWNSSAIVWYASGSHYIPWIQMTANGLSPEPVGGSTRPFPIAIPLKLAFKLSLFLKARL
jgi:hypothetical protein